MSVQSIAILLIEQFADWEAGFLTSTARTHLGAHIHYLTPDGEDVKSMGGLVVSAQGDWQHFSAQYYAALAIIGSPNWHSDAAPDVSAPVKAMLAAQKPVGFICGATLAAARMGLLDACHHTGNSVDELKAIAAYKGADHYVDQATAYTQGNLITASGTAPHSFAMAFLERLYPDAIPDLNAYVAMFAHEHRVK